MAVEMFFMTKSPQKNVPDVGIELGAACMPSELASDRATAPGQQFCSLSHNILGHSQYIYTKFEDSGSYRS